VKGKLAGGGDGEAGGGGLGMNGVGAGSHRDGGCPAIPWVRER
jgi:hypothetical protein